MCASTLKTVTDLIEVGVGLRLSHSVEVLHVDQLEVVGEAGVGHLELGQLLDVGQVPQLLVAPVVQFTQAGRTWGGKHEHSARLTKKLPSLERM